MSKYYNLDASDEGEGNSKLLLSVVGAIGLVIITVLLMGIFIWDCSSWIMVYGGDPVGSSIKYTDTRSGKERSYNSSSLAGRCASALARYGVNKFGKIKYEGYFGGNIPGEAGVEERGTHGRHQFYVTDFNGVKGSNKHVMVLLEGAFEEPRVGAYWSIVANVSEARQGFRKRAPRD